MSGALVPETPGVYDKEITRRLPLYVSHRKNIPARKIENSVSRFVTKQVLVGPAQGWEDYVMRLFTLEKDGHAPRHSHDWPPP